MDYLYKILNTLFSALPTLLIGAALGHLLTKKRDKDNNLNKLEREIFGLLNAISFSLSTQYSELYNLKKNLENRLAILSDPTRMQERDDRITALQDFALDSSPKIKFEYITDLSYLIPSRFPDYQLDPSILQSCHISNKKYSETIKILQGYCDMKQSISKDANLANELNNFLIVNIPIYLKMLDIYMPFIKSTQESLKELFSLVGKKPFQISEPMKLWG